jgi:hypothetical protein
MNVWHVEAETEPEIEFMGAKNKIKNKYDINLLLIL